MTLNLTVVILQRLVTQEWPKCVKKGLFVPQLGMERVNADQHQQLVGYLKQYRHVS